MSSKRPSPFQALFLGLMVLPPISILIAIPWLKQQPAELVFLLSGIAATLTVFSSFVLAILHDRRLDEWQRSNARFSSQWGWVAGASLISLILAIPQVRDLIVSVAGIMGQVTSPDQRLVIVTFTFGFIATVIAQQLCTIILSIGWTLWKSRAARESA